MNSVRLLPVVMVVASTLLLFKIFGFVSGNLYVFGDNVAIAQEAEAAAEGEEPVEEEPINPVANAANAALNPERPKDARPITLDGNGKIQELSEATGVGVTEIQFLERLSERRQLLDDRESKLATQEAIVRAAELRLESRANELREIEKRISSLVDQKETQEVEQFKQLVAMYENMKPKDAARIFNRLDMLVLVRMVEQINPRKMAVIMASMDDKKAEALTINLASPGLEQMAKQAMEQASGELPQIVGQ